MRLIQVTSPTTGNGKTTTIANLAVVLARAGQQVAVVSCDLRRSRIHDFFGVPGSVGFTSVLVGNTPLSQAFQAIPGEARLELLPSGAPPPNPSELLASRRGAEVIEAIGEKYEVVLIDCPPVLPVTDAAVLSARVDGILMVVMAGTTTGKQLTRTVQLLRQVDAPLVGVVLNGAPPEDAYGYEFRYFTAKEHAERGKAASVTGPEEARQESEACHSARDGGC